MARWHGPTTTRVPGTHDPQVPHPPQLGLGETSHLIFSDIYHTGSWSVPLGELHGARRTGRSPLVRGGARAIAAVGLPVSFPQGAGRWEELHAAMMSDKKVRSGRLRLVLLDAVARPVRLDAPGEELLRAAHEAVSRP